MNKFDVKLLKTHLEVVIGLNLKYTSISPGGADTIIIWNPIMLYLLFNFVHN